MAASAISSFRELVSSLITLAYIYLSLLFSTCSIGSCQRNPPQQTLTLALIITVLITPPSGKSSVDFWFYSQFPLIYPSFPSPHLFFKKESQEKPVFSLCWKNPPYFTPAHELHIINKTLVFTIIYILPIHNLSSRLRLSLSTSFLTLRQALSPTLLLSPLWLGTIIHTLR